MQALGNPCCEKSSSSSGCQKRIFTTTTLSRATRLGEAEKASEIASAVVGTAIFGFGSFEEAAAPLGPQTL